jgi:hypothetical protein
MGDSTARFRCSRVGTVAAWIFWLSWRFKTESTSAVKMKIQALSFFRDGGHARGLLMTKRM